ncbi:hypothetical protein ABVT39_028383 [Epinephelus coioides]
MAGWKKNWRTLRLLVLFSLIILSEQFEVRDDEWEELGPDIAALHRLRGLHEHMFHERLKNPSDQRGTSIHGARAKRSSSGTTTDKNPMSLLDDLQESENFAASVIQRGQDFDSFLAAIDEQKTQDWLLRASEISRSYSQKLLVMTDEESSTNERVQQEYSLDPHNSLIVSKECLYNISCVPEADSYTIVKIFGNVSEDGETISGLSGSSLAELVLNPSLKTAPVFSLDGNTTKQFQYSFIRVFMASGTKAVLETNQENQQTYLAMTELESVSSYQSQTPADHTTHYDHQQILIMEDDSTIKDAAVYLYENHPTTTSVYTLDSNQKPELIHGAAVPLSEDSTLVLVGHGKKDSGEMTLAGHTARDVAKIIQHTFRVSDEIKTTSVVAPEVGSDKAFVETLLRELHDTANIETELHLRDTLVQVRHTGEKITPEIVPEGLRWRGKGDSKKVVANRDRKGNVLLREEPASRGEAVFPNERNLLIPKNPDNRFKVYRDSWPDVPKRFIDQNVLEKFDSAAQIRHACDELEALSWAFFHTDLPLPEKINTENLNLKEYFLTKKIYLNNENKWKSEKVVNKREQKNILSHSYKIKSGKDVRNIIHHYAKTGENSLTYLMVKDWIFSVHPISLYVAPIGKKLDNNQIEDDQKINEVHECISDHIDKEKYSDMRPRILQDNNINNPKESYTEYVKGIFLGEHTTTVPLSTEAWYTTYFTASVISESARNFRTFPLVLMALDMADSPDNNIREKGQDFLLEEHSMARGLTWVDPSRRGFSGSATPEGSSKLENIKNRRSKKDLMNDLKKLITREVKQYQSWIQDENEIWPQILKTAEKYQITESNSVQETNNYKTFKTKDSSRPSASGSLGGYDDGQVTPQDLKSASELENSVKLESYFSRVRVLSAEQIHTQLTAKYGENLAELSVQGDSARIENGQFICQLFMGADTEPHEFRAELSPESQSYNDRLLESIDTAINDMEVHSSTSSHQVNKYVEHTGTAVGTLGLMLGMRGAVRAFEQGDILDGVVGSLQTAHGVTTMTTSVIARQTLSSQTRITRAATAIMKSPAIKGTMTVIPVVGMGFGVYNLAQDLKRGDTLGYIDAALDAGMIPLDALAIVQPEVAPLIVALSAVRTVIDDVYMGIQNELENIPKEAGVLEKLRAVSFGFVKGTLHFAIHVASFFYNWRYDEIAEGHRLVEQISDYHKYYRITKEQDGTRAIDFSGGDASWNGGGIYFDLADQGESELCLHYFVSIDESYGKRCEKIDTHGSKDIILGLGESHQLEYTKLQKKILMFIPAGSVNVVSGYKAVSNSSYGVYKGNRDANRFFAIQKAEQKMIQVMLNYYYMLYGEPGDDIFYLGPQRSFVQGSSGKDTYIIPENGGKTTINNYDPSKALDILHFSVNYSQISVSKSGDDVVLMYESSHSVTIQGWFLGELFRHMTMMSGDGVLFEISSTVISSVQLVARGINKMFKTRGEIVHTSEPLLSTVTNILGTPYNDELIGNRENNLIDGGGGVSDYLIGGEGEDIYIVKDRGHREESSVWINNGALDSKIDMVIIEANFHTFKARAEGHNVVLNAFHDNAPVNVIIVNWFRLPAYRHLLVVTKDLITFTISDNKADCLESDPFNKCIKSRSIDYSNSTSALAVDLEKDEAFGSVTEVHGSEFDDDIRGNKHHNVIFPGKGNDFIEGRGGEDWYVITPGQGVKTINNKSPDLALDILFLKEQYHHIKCSCEEQSIIIWVHGKQDVILQNWFDSKNYQHLQIKTSDGITAGLMPNHSSCAESLMFPLTADYRNQEPEPLHSLQTTLQKRSVDVEDDLTSSGHDGCFRYTRKNSEDRFFCDRQGKVMMMNNAESVKEMYGSSGFDIMVGNSKENLLDPYTGGALMFGGEGKDTYIIKHEYGNNLLIDNFAEDQNIDTVLVDMDFFDGSQVAFDSSTADLNVTITTNGEQLKFSLLNYNDGDQHQHLEFLSSDGVTFKLISLNSTEDAPSFQIEAFKVTLKQLQVDCRLDFSFQSNLSKVHTVQGCPAQSNDILGNDRDNVLIGGWKDDALEGGEGDDTLIGGKGADILIGDLGDDTLYGGDGNDTMMGNSGRDVFIPGPGADLVDGGPGRDAVLYRGDPDTGKGVYVNLLTGQGRYADAEGDVLKDIETVIGTIYSDVLVSGYESALLKGSDGNDILASTGGDYLVGGDGNDIYMLAFHHGSVTIDNCAHDTATDVLYLSSQSTQISECQRLTDKVLLTFSGPNQSTVNIALKGWISDDNECGHLKFFYRNGEVSVSELLQECQSK